ncbi:hypothetical protein JW711_00005, partial [Candidatus Woesearchaeota archaeon]|nr:hypothetical protein [Candidatus Woesearchaeota archaeon]
RKKKEKKQKKEKKNRKNKMIFSIQEIIDIIVMTLVIGFIFKDFFKKRPKVEVLLPKNYDPLKKHQQMLNWDDFWFAVAVVGPSIILHEFGHKFFAISQGLAAEFHAAYTWLVLGIILKLISFGFIFFVPAYTSIIGNGTNLQFAGVAFAGPAVNLLLWLISAYVLKNYSKKLKGDWYHFFFLMSKINMFLFLFNMLPIPGFDGWSFFGNMFKAIF